MSEIPSRKYSPLFLKGELEGISQSLARELRKNMTDAERLLWSKIRRKQVRGYQFYRQRTIGNYIVDFYCPRAKVAIEVDGGQHYSRQGAESDKHRDIHMRNFGLRVLRFSNIGVLLNIDGVHL
jgi:very-short-patch-repair endonuclease